MTIFLLCLQLFCHSGIDKNLYFACDSSGRAAATEHRRNGIRLYEEGKWEAAIAELDKSIHADPANAVAYTYRGLSRQKLMLLDGALGDFNKAISIDKDYPWAYMGKGTCYYLQDKWAESISSYDTAIYLDENSIPALIGRGTSRIAAGDTGKAIEDFDRAIKLDGKSAVALNNRGRAYEIRQQWENAVRDFDKAIECDPEYYTPLVNRARLRCECPQEKHRDGQLALQDAKAAYDISKGNDPDVLEVLASAYAEIGNYRLAVQWQQAALKNPTYAKQNGVEGRERLKTYRQRVPHD